MTRSTQAHPVAEIMSRRDMQAQPSNADIGAGHPRIHESESAHNAPNRDAAPNATLKAKDRRWKRNRPSPPKSRLGGCASWLDALL